MLKTFSIGGVHPHENKLSAHQPIIKAEIPAKAAILLGQHIGAPAKPIVAKGDVVKVGTKIACACLKSCCWRACYPCFASNNFRSCCNNA